MFKPIVFLSLILIVSGSGLNISQLIQEDFVHFDPSYPANYAKYYNRLNSLNAQVAQLVKQGHDMSCSTQIFSEAKILVSYTATNFEEVDHMCTLLEQSLQDTNQTWAAQQQKDGGFWGPCFQRFIFKLQMTSDALGNLMTLNQKPQYPVTFINPVVGTPELVQEYVHSRQPSQIWKTGVNNRADLAGFNAILNQFVFKDEFRKWINANVDGLTISDELVTAYTTLVNQWQDPETGFWGAWFNFYGRNDVIKGPDVSVTYHTVAYREGDINYVDKMAMTLLQDQNGTYPYGWLWRINQQTTTHNLYDVVKMYEKTWSRISDQVKSHVSAAVPKMLDFGVNNSVSMQDKFNGTFACDLRFYVSLGSCYYFGVSFLSVAGYFTPANQFWASTPINYPESHDLCCQLTDTIVNRLKLSGGLVPGAVQRLKAACPTCSNQ